MPERPILRKATLDDLDFLIRVDLKDEGSSSDFYAQFTEEELQQHRKKIGEFIDQPDRGAWVHEVDRKPISAILYTFRTRNEKLWDSDRVYDEIDPSLFPQDGRFCEVFQLWVHPNHRRQGLATELKMTLEHDALVRGVKMLYTHTEDCNLHVIEMNLKLGFKEVRRGPIWDEFVRVSLVKVLE
jgi:GNAT superfamily N-acetyltransferase